MLRMFLIRLPIKIIQVDLSMNTRVLFYDRLSFGHLEGITIA